MSRSLQYARTDRDITEAFLKLLQEEAFEKITGGDIIGEAMASHTVIADPDVDQILSVQEEVRQLAEGRW